MLYVVCCSTNGTSPSKEAPMRIKFHMDAELSCSKKELKKLLKAARKAAKAEAKAAKKAAKAED